MNKTIEPDDLGGGCTETVRSERGGGSSVAATEGAPAADVVPDQHTKRHRFVPSEEVVQAFAELPPVDVEAWYRDVDPLEDDRLTLPDESVDR